MPRTRRQRSPATASPACSQLPRQPTGALSLPSVIGAATYARSAAESRLRWNPARPT
ncbi:hypothetical protein ACWCRD_22690 [Streptomyces sp. NPDC002092]